MSLARVFCSWSIASVLLLLSIALSNSAESEKSLNPVVTDETGQEGNGTANVTLTGNPQIDYVHDPNLPRELNGYNLSDYPFYHRVPKNINFSCDGRKDGFYASVEHKCQIYHHCLFGNRYDFICANYTAFDQRTFICQFVSDVDCPNSHMYFHRNKDLYVTKSSTTAAPIFVDRAIYDRRRPPKKPRNKLRPSEDTGSDTQQSQAPSPQQESTTAAPTQGSSGDSASPAPAKKDGDYDDYYEEDWDYPVRRPVRPRRRFRKCRGGRRRGRRCRPRRPPSYYYDDDDYTYDDDYDYAYYDDVRPRKGGKKRRPVNAIPAGTSQSSSSETPPPTSSTPSTTTSRTTTTTTEPSYYSTSSELSTGPLDSESIAVLQKQRDELLTKTRRPLPNVRPPAFLRPSRQNDKSKAATSTSTTTTTTEKARPTTTTTTTTTEVPQYIYDYEYYEDDTGMEVSSTTTSTTTQKPLFRGKLRGGNSAAALLEKQRVQQSIQVRVTEDQGTNTNTIRRRDNSNVQTPLRAATPPTTTTTTSTSQSVSTSTPVSRPARFWQRKSTVKSVSTTTSIPSTTTTTTTSSPAYYQEYQDYDDVTDPQPSGPTGPTSPSGPSAPAPKPQPQQSSKYQPFPSAPQHQYGTSPSAVSIRQQSYASNNAPQQPQAPQPLPQPTGDDRPHTLSSQSVTASRGGALGHSTMSGSNNNYAAPRPNKHYPMQQQYSQSSSSSSSISSSNSNTNNNNNYNTNSYHRQRSPPQPVPKPEFISLVDEDYNNPYSPVGGALQASPATPPRGGAGGRLVASPGYVNQHPIRFFEQQSHPAFLFAASEYSKPQFAFPPRTFPSPSNFQDFQPYHGHSTRRFSAQNMFQK